MKSIPPLALSDDAIALKQPAEPEKPFTVAGQCGAMMGQQNGSFESWIFPVKLFSHLSLTAEVEGYDVPIDVNRVAAEIQVSPDHTTITYSHIAFTLKEILFANQCGQQDGTGVVAVFELSSIRPVTLTLSFTPEMKRMWPAPISGDVDPEWVKLGPAESAGLNDTTRPGGAGAVYPSGWYMLHTEDASLAGAMALPGSQPGIMPPYQEKPQTYPLQFVLRFDPKRDSGRGFPLLMAVGTTSETATRAALEDRLAHLNESIPLLSQQNQEYYARFFDTRLTTETPDAAFDRDIRWAELSIDQDRVRHQAEVGLVAGFFSSGSSARPGFGWFFGRDTLFSTWGINSYGDSALTRQALSFLLHRQRADGKMPHELSQTAELVDWAHLPYEYAAADATPLFLMAMDDYVTTSGDLSFLHSQWPAIQRAWRFETTHDSDGDGIYDNSQGTGWVESWPQGMPHQEVYLASLDQQASVAMVHLFRLSGDATGAQSAQARSDAIRSTMEREYRQKDGTYAFSHNADGSADATASIYPAIAWWGGHSSLSDSTAMFERWASDEFSTDWGTRDVGQHEAVYDPISYHQGSVWPLFTGWASLAEYRSARPLSGYTHLMQNANLTTAQDLGAVTELLSGSYYAPFGRSTSHQMWSSAMVLIPAIRGLFGVSVDALNGIVTVDPHLPASWTTAALHHVQVGSKSIDLRFTRIGQQMQVVLDSKEAFGIKLASTVPGARASGKGREIAIPLAAIEVGLPFEADNALPLPGASTSRTKILDEHWQPHQLTLKIEGQGSTQAEFYLRRNIPTIDLKVEGGILRESSLIVPLPAGEGYQTTTVKLSW